MLVQTSATLSKPIIFLPNFVESKPVVRSVTSTTTLGKEFGCNKLVFFGKRGRNVIPLAEFITSDGFERDGVLMERHVLADDSFEFQAKLCSWWTRIQSQSYVMDWLGMNGIAITLTGFLLAIGSYFSWLRVSQQFHTIRQVVAGAFLGSMFAILWFWMWESIMLKAFISIMWVRFIVAFGGAVVSLGSTLYIFGTMLWTRRLQCAGIINPR